VLRGYVRVEQADKIELRVRVPGAARRFRTWVNGRAVRQRVAGGYAVFRLGVGEGAVADWAVTWAGPKP